MSPPTDHLIRDYLKRLSVAAQGRLNRDDRRALIDRTRGYIEHNTGLSGPATMLEVAAVLSRLGDPSQVVATEVERLAEMRGDGGAPLAPSWTGWLARTGRREPGRLSASWHWPARPGSRSELHEMLTGARTDADPSAGDPLGRDASARDASQKAATENTATEAAGTASAGVPIPASGLEALGLVGPRADHAGGTPGIAEPGSFSAAAASQHPSWPHGPAIRRDEATVGQAQHEAEDHAVVGPAEAAGLAAAEGLAGREPETSPVAAASDGDAGQVADGPAGSEQRHAREMAAGAGYGEESTAGEENAAAEVALAGPRRLAAAVVEWSREKTLESVATILLGLGGLIFPPIWLLGAMVALASKVWDHRDKWLGLGVPVLLTIIGTAAGVMLAGSQLSLGYDVHVGWVSADVASRASAVLGATYLAWRSVQGKRPPAVPPWNRPHQVR